MAARSKVDEANTVSEAWRVDWFHLLSTELDGQAAADDHDRRRGGPSRLRQHDEF